MLNDSELHFVPYFKDKNDLYTAKYEFGIITKKSQTEWEKQHFKVMQIQRAEYIMTYFINM